MNEYSIPMAIADFIPVLLFTVSAVILLRDLYAKMNKGNYALFAAGMIMSIVAGFMKATWKILYAANVCDFQRLTQAFMPMQSTGLFFAGLAMIAMMFTKTAKEQGGAVVKVEKLKAEPAEEAEKLSVVALPLILLTAPALLGSTSEVPLYTSSLVFIIGLVSGLLLMTIVLCIAAARLRKIHVIIFFILTFVLMCGMGYMGSSAFEAKMEGKIALKNWIEQGVNGTAQLLFLLGCIGLHRGGLKELCMYIKAKKD